MVTIREQIKYLINEMKPLQRLAFYLKFITLMIFVLGFAAFMITGVYMLFHNMTYINTSVKSSFGAIAVGTLMLTLSSAIPLLIIIVLTSYIYDTYFEEADRRLDL